MVERLHLPFPVLSDAESKLTHALSLPTFDFAGVTLLKRFTFVIEGGHIAHLIYPVFPSNADAPAIVEWLRARASA